MGRLCATTREHGREAVAAMAQPCSSSRPTNGCQGATNYSFSLGNSGSRAVISAYWAIPPPALPPSRLRPHAHRPSHPAQLQRQHQPGRLCQLQPPRRLLLRAQALLLSVILIFPAQTSAGCSLGSHKATQSFTFAYLRSNNSLKMPTKHKVQLANDNNQPKKS